MHESRILASPPMLLILLSLVIASFFNTTAGQIGVCYGMQGEMLPSPSDVVALYKQQNIQRMRLYAPNPDALNALRGSNIELLLNVPNPDLQRLASSQVEADIWIRNYANGVRFRYISVGNEVQPSDPAARFVLPAMQNIERAVSGLGINVSTALGVKISTAIDTRGISGFPPSSGNFTPEFKNFIAPVIGFLSSKQSPLLVNLCPYFTYTRNMRDVRLDYTLFAAPSTVFTDGQNQYRNVFHAILDTVYASLEKA